MGDPAGIGPEVVLKAVAEEEVRNRCVPVIIGDAQLLAHTARTLDLQSGYDIVRYGESLPADLVEPIIFHLDNVGGFIEPGIESGAAGKAAAGYIEAAVDSAAGNRCDSLRRSTSALFLVVTVSPVTPNSSLIRPALRSTPWPRSQAICERSSCRPFTASQAIRPVERERLVRVINLAHRECSVGIERPRIAVAA
jgi:4-hydroxythreonine-4-phosphate dehydrogenase